MITHALILAAGRGERMRPLTDTTPKPLLAVGGKPLIEWHLEKLARIGVADVVINISHLAERFPETLGDGRRWGIRIHYSYEGPQPLETGGGMLRALPSLGSGPFIAVSADIFSEFDYASLPAEPAGLAHLVMVPNPDFLPGGDFWLELGRLNEKGMGERLTFGNIGVYRPELLACESARRFRLLPLYQRAMRMDQLSGERYDGFWRNLGTPGQLDELDARLRGAAE